nr:hypothetical protein [Tanacetum cinerariifolium]
GRIEAKDADEEITLVDIEIQADLGAKVQGRKDDDNAAIKEASVADPFVFDDEEMAKRLHDEEIEQAAAREKQEKDDLEKDKVVQKQYVDKQENIDWNVVVEQMQEKHLDNIRKYQSLKRKPISIAQAMKNMIVYLKNMVGYKMEHFKVEVSGSHSTQDTPTDDPKEMSEEDAKNMLEIVPISKFKVKALQVKYPLID